MKNLDDLILRDTLIEVNLDNIIFNMKSIRELVGDNVAIAAVVKANGYGHGAIGIAETLMENGAEYLAVAALNEAMDLRKHFKDYKILIMGYTPDEYLEYVVKYNITQTIFSYEQGINLNKLGEELGKKPVVHIKYDTGFNRLGYRHCKESIDEIEKISKLSNLELEGIFSHLALARKEENHNQYSKFIEAIEELEKRGVRFKYKHIEESITAVDYPEYHMNMIRPGAIIYGIKGFHIGTLDLKQALKFKTKLYHIKKISKGEGVSYDYLWKAEKDTFIGTIPLGYGDGYPRNLRDKGYVTIHGKKAPIIGVICMDQCMVDLNNIPEAKVGDEVIIYGDGNNNTMDINEASLLAGTNKNDIISRITLRTPRVYTKEGKIVNCINYIG